MQAKRNPTIKDVAKAANLSVTTVSFVLNGKGDAIPDATKEQVYSAVERLNYCPNYTARSLVTQKTNMIGIIVPEITNSFFAELVHRLQNGFSAQGYDIILCDNEETVEKDLRYINLLAGRNVDGLILAPSGASLLPENTVKIQNALRSLSMPVLFLDRYFGDFAPHVSVDNCTSAYSVTDYLLQKGHKKIGVVTGAMRLNSSFNRLKGVRKRLAEDGIQLPDANIYEGQYDIATGERAAEKFMQTDVTAIFAFSDMQAYGIYKKLKEHGKRVPDDVSVVGFDDNVYSVLLDKPLTTMRQPMEKLAADAVRSMLRMIRKEPYEKPTKSAAELIERESVKKLP
ncbi:MAG: LacI family transcriptional regulator [Clostridia bacterium]|jgi:LacI family transcriptional regulator|nr:LacI family transcriptional regulator [Clostridia bacterium]